MSDIRDALEFKPGRCSGDGKWICPDCGEQLSSRHAATAHCEGDGEPAGGDVTEHRQGQERER
jgi:hypothetical protein